MKNNESIKKITVTTDGYVGEGYTVCVDFETRVINWATSGFFYPQLKPIKTLTEEENLDFKKKVEALNILDWQKKYYDLGCLDGSIWELQVETDHGIKKFKGTAAYPENWESFCAWVQEVCQKPFK